MRTKQVERHTDAKHIEGLPSPAGQQSTQGLHCSVKTVGCNYQGFTPERELRVHRGFRPVASVGSAPTAEAVARQGGSKTSGGTRQNYQPGK